MSSAEVTDVLKKMRNNVGVPCICSMVGIVKTTLLH